MASRWRIQADVEIEGKQIVFDQIGAVKMYVYPCDIATRLSAL
jgi:hypothetical protein